MESNMRLCNPVKAFITPQHFQDDSTNRITRIVNICFIAIFVDLVAVTLFRAMSGDYAPLFLGEYLLLS
jgi:hypothetical protein